MFAAFPVWVAKGAAVDPQPACAIDITLSAGCGERQQMSEFPAIRAQS
jgi:hypothetical protein